MPLRHWETAGNAPIRVRPAKAGAIYFVALVMLSFLIAQGWALVQMRDVEIDNARIATFNMTRALAQQADDTLRAADVALVGVVDRLNAEGMAPSLLAQIERLLKQTAAKLPALDGVNVYDAQGRGLITSRQQITSSFDIADREYFQYHARNNDTQAHVGTPNTSRVSGALILPISRRINHADGTFAGVAVATIEIAYFREFQARFKLENQGAIMLMTDTGIMVTRRPFDAGLVGADVTRGPVFKMYRSTGPEGTAVMTAKVDGIERLYSYRHLDHYPLVVASALSMNDVLAAWRKNIERTLATGAVLLFVLMVFGLRLIALIGERERAQQALTEAQHALESVNRELERLSLQDGLTGLSNRRHFDMALEEEFKRAMRAHTPLALLMIDVDFFKRFNDTYGHPAGDDCLKQLGTALRLAHSRPGDLAARYGGEELVVLLPNTDTGGAAELAERFRQAVLEQAIPHAGNPAGFVTVSIGVASCRPGRNQASGNALIEAADKALYRAKDGGRNRVCADLPKLRSMVG